MCLPPGVTPATALAAHRAAGQAQWARDCYEAGPAACALGIRNNSDLAAYCYKHSLPGLGVCLGDQELAVASAYVKLGYRTSQIALMAELGLLTSGASIDIGEGFLAQDLAGEFESIIGPGGVRLPGIPSPGLSCGGGGWGVLIS